MAKDTVILIKQQVTGWKIIFINYSFNGELISKIYKEVINRHQESKQPNFKIGYKAK